MSRHIVALVTGVIFGLGLAVSQMMNPEKVLAFLDVTGDWDPSLAFVMGGAVAVTLLSFRRVLRLPKPLFGERFEVPSNDAIDGPLLAGAIIFGIGWGVAGYCPGPAIASLTIGSVEPAIFIGAFIVGNFLAIRWQAFRE
ncbi:MAG: YeeE/YedE family protein [Proteobacteria bacterium]|nr:YeeE/YedE family protein [Pseudomonadota bacterium]